MPAGYRHPAYVTSLREFGDPLALPESGGALLARAVPGHADRDAMGAYPLFACEDWGGLAADLESLEGLVSVTLVADPFGAWTLEQLDAAFPDLRRPFKEHYVHALAPQPLGRASAHHQKYAARGLRRTAVETVVEPLELLDDWNALYGTLVRRHGITGLSAFSPASFAAQLAVPGIVAFRAVEQDAVVGAALWYEDAGVAYWHLAAYSERGYKLDASYALLATALEHFQTRGLEWICLGAGAGLSGEATDGLSRFKAGWATGTRTAHLCGRVLDPARYAALGGATDGFFPAYRAP